MITVLGLIAASLTTLAFGPQAYKAWVSKSTKDISLLMYSLVSLGIFLWLIYGILIFDLPLIFANTISLFLSLSILLAKLIFK